ncbi:TonB-linked outer membrane protein, SusC/RagA family [Xylanibacter oryzae DSM 17970]|uniref:TonB-linked outer membrane protein, SusC/RagA family n=1 Tax=Xylanibacter oryzae DSM 17970 TaxID=915438 RepID=A0ABP3BEZ6_9BACT|nr:TonB-dependent receptor [Xylanibacter oryzae]EXG77813.1 TonB-linked outer membrane protein, SusC/RagA family [Xylanibacter oryzae DSM 17970]
MRKTLLRLCKSSLLCNVTLIAFLLFTAMNVLEASSLDAKTVTGTVTSAIDHEPLVGVTVKVLGVPNGSVTDVDGKYSINVESGQILQFSYVGYLSKTVKVGIENNINVVLKEDHKSLDEVVVVGYGVMKRSDLTGSVSSIDEKAIKQGVNTTIEQAMQGRIAGVAVTQNSGAPGGGISVQIRGVNSLSSNEPLYVIDGIAMSGSSSDNTSALSSINPSDITNIEVLKDASATAIYGSRASNGVVLITTKRGHDGKAKIQYEGYIGWQQLPKTLDMMNLKDYASFYNERANILGWGVRSDYKDPSLLTNGTDWQNVLFRTAFMDNHQVNVSGGAKDIAYSLSGGYLDQDGVGVGSSFNRASFRANFDIDVNKYIKLGMNGYFANTKQVTTFDQSNAIQTALNQFPDVAPVNPDGTYGFPQVNDFATYYSNPLFEAQMRENNSKNSSLDYNFFANITPIKGLTLRVEYGGSYGWGNTYYFQPSYSYGTVRVESLSTRGSSKNEYNSFKQYATYDIDPFKNQHMQIMLGHEAQWGKWQNLSASRKGYISDALHSLNVGDSSTATNTGDGGTPWSIESYYGRLNYNILDRYMLTATVRTDGSSSFGENNRWGWFPSAAIAWRISNEKFMKSIHWIDNMKIRLGWGLVGNQSAGSYAYGATMANTPTAWGTGYYPGNFSNQDLKWESTNSLNIGLDLNLFNNRIEFIADAYYKKTKNLLMQAQLPSYVINNDYMGMSSPWVNAGSMENKGIEFTLNTININTHGWQWRTGITISFNRNKLTKTNSSSSALSGTIGSQTYTMSEVGDAVGRFYGYNVIGMYTKESDFYQKNKLGEFLLDHNGNKIPVARPVDSSGNLYDISKTGIWVGDYIFEDVNGDGKITEADRKYIGDPNPDYTFGISNTITYKNFELSFFLNGSVGNDIYNIVKQNSTNFSKYSNLLKEATNYAKIGLINPNGSALDISNVYITNAETASYPRIYVSGGSMNDNNRISSRFVEDGSYIRLKSLSFAWNLPDKWLQPLKLEWVQIYANAQNLFTITGYDGYDPEVGSIGQSVILHGIDNYRYPSQRIYNFGIKVRF